MKYFNRKIRDLRQNRLCEVLAVGLFLSLPCLTLAASPGDLDLTFGTGGIVITTGSHINNLNYATGMAIQKDGKIVVVGDGANGTTWDFAVVRYNTDGSLDTSFGGTGIVITPVGDSHDGALSVAIQTDGKIVAAGYSYTGGNSFAVTRYNSDGSLDTSFNGSGKVITNVGNSGYARSVALQPDGKIVAAGLSGPDFALVRYQKDGKLDTSFYGTGKVITPVGDGYRSYARSVAIQPDGKIVAAGESRNGLNYAFAVVRYIKDGKLDTTFNGTGKVITPVGSFDSGAADLAIQSDGKIVTAGYARIDDDSDFAIVRYEPNGMLDPSFGGTGHVIVRLGDSRDYAYSVALQMDGRIVAAGSRGNIIGSDFAIVRLDPGGSLDTTFNGTGKVFTHFGGQDAVSTVELQTDGKIVAAGGVDNRPLYDFYDFAVVRYLGDPVSTKD